MREYQRGKRKPTSVKVDLHDTVSNGSAEVIDARSRSTVEHEEDGLRVVGSELLFDIGLVLGKEVRLELDVSRLVDTVDIAESSCDTKVRRDGAEGVIDVPDVLGLGVEGVVVDVLVVDTL